MFDKPLIHGTLDVSGSITFEQELNGYYQLIDYAYVSFVESKVAELESKVAELHVEQQEKRRLTMCKICLKEAGIRISDAHIITGQMGLALTAVKEAYRKVYTPSFDSLRQGYRVSNAYIDAVLEDPATSALEYEAATQLGRVVSEKARKCVLAIADGFINDYVNSATGDFSFEDIPKDQVSNIMIHDNGELGIFMENPNPVNDLREDQLITTYQATSSSGVVVTPGPAIDISPTGL